jgi:Lon protease-like protein
VSRPDTTLLAGALDAVPVFPLPHVVLFPRAVVPLHIFEPRYRSLLADALASHACMVMAVAAGDGERPRMATVACAGVVVQHEPLPDGRANILLQGLARVEIEELPFVAPYRRARARVLEDAPGTVRDADLTALRSAASAFIAEARLRGVEVELELPASPDPSAAADLCAHHLVVDSDARQRALELLDVTARVLLVTGELVAQTARLARPTRGEAN